LLAGLQQAGFRQAVGSSAPRANLDLILRLTGAAKYFDALVTAEDTQRGKPDPQVFLVAAERVGAAPAKCVVLEDAPAGVQAARAGGMKCIAVSFVGHQPDDKLKQAGADVVVKCLTAVSAAQVERLIDA
jgi:beta-phosphoglucomutase